MIYLDELEFSLKENNNSLKIKKDEFLSQFIELNINDDILKLINDDLVNYFKNNINNYNLSEEELISINKSINYYNSIKSLDIDLNNLFIEDKKILNLKESIKLLYYKSLEYREMICSNIDFQIRNNNSILSIISKIKELVLEDEIDVVEIQRLINILPLIDKQKFTIFGEIYKKYIDKIRKYELYFESDVTGVLRKIRIETEPSVEIEENIETQGIKLEITDDDRELQELIRELLFNIKKLNSKFPTDIYNQSTDIKVQTENEILINDRIKLNDLLVSSEELTKKFEKYLSDKDIIWENDVSKDELEQEIKTIYKGILEKYNELNKIYLDILKDYKKRVKDSFDEIEVDAIDQTVEYPPIIFWFGNNRIINEDNYIKVNEFLQEFDSYPEVAFYSSDFLPALDLLKQQSSFVKFKENGISTNIIDEVRGVGNAIPFKEVKLRNGSGGGTARIYYDTFKTNKGKNYILVYLIHNKTDAYDKEAYQAVEGYLKSKIYQNKLSTVLDNPAILDEFKKLEEYVYQNVRERANKEIALINNNQNMQQTIGNGGTK